MRTTDTTMITSLPNQKYDSQGSFSQLELLCFGKSVFIGRKSSEQMPGVHKQNILSSTNNKAFGKFKTSQHELHYPQQSVLWGSARVHHHKSDYQLGTLASNLSVKPFLGSGPYEGTVQAEDHNHQDLQTALSPKHTKGIRAGCWTEPAGEAETGREAALSRGCRGRARPGAADRKSVV